MDPKKALLELHSKLQDQLELIRERDFARESLESAPRMAEFLGYTLIGKIHYDIEKRIKNRTKPHYLLLMHRHGIKSTVFNYADNVRLLTKDPVEESIGLFSASNPVAMGMLAATKNIFENNEKYRKFYGEMQGNKWNDEQINVNGSQFRAADSTCSMECFGPEKGMANKHFRRLRADDLVNEENYKHKSSRESIKDAFKKSFNLLRRDPWPGHPWPAEYGVIGTRYHPNDLYDYIIKEMSDVFEIIIIKPTIVISGVEEPVLKKVFPDMATLDRVKKELGPYGYACQMEQDPYFSEDSSLKWDKVKVLDADELQKIFADIKGGKIPQEKLAVVMDPANEVERGANSTGIALMYFDGRRLCVLRVWKYKGILSEVINLAADILFEWGIKYFYCEKSGLESSIESMLSLKLREHGLERYVIMAPVSHKKEAKNSRIMALQPLAEEGMIYRAGSFTFRSSREAAPTDQFEELREEWSGFPNLAMDDLLDPIAYSIREEVFDIAVMAAPLADNAKSDRPPPDLTEAEQAQWEHVRRTRVRPEDDE